MFEAGAISKAVSISSVCPYLIDADFTDIANADPLAQFQAKKAERNSTLELLRSINQKAPNPIAESRLEHLFEALWPQFQEKLEAIQKRSVETTDTKEEKVEEVKRTQEEILEELVGTLRAVDGRLDQLEVTVSSSISQDKTRANREPILLRVELEGTKFEVGKTIRIRPPLSIPFEKVVAEVAGLNVDAFGIEWDLWDPTRETFLTREEAKDINSFFGDYPRELALTEGIPF